MLLNAKNLPHKTGIYKIENLINHKVYIGQSKDIYRRYHSHHKFDCYNDEKSSYNFQIYQAIRKYGEENFTIDVVELCDENLLDERECYWIKYYNSYHNGYNATEGGQYWSENIHSEETERKRAETRAKNHTFQGEKHPRAKLSNEEVIYIRQRYKDGETIKEIYQDYQTLYANIDTFRRIILGQTYKNVGNIPNKNEIRFTNAKLTADQVKEIRRRYKEEKISYAKLGTEYGVTSGAIASIIQRKTYRHIK